MTTDEQLKTVARIKKAHVLADVFVSDLTDIARWIADGDLIHTDDEAAILKRAAEIAACHAEDRAASHDAEHRGGGMTA